MLLSYRYSFSNDILKKYSEGIQFTGSNMGLKKNTKKKKNPGDCSSILEILFKLFKLSESNDVCHIYALGSLL